MENVLFVPIILGFIVTLFVIPYWIKRSREAGLVGKDIHKLDKKEVAEGGGSQFCLVLFLEFWFIFQ